MDEPRQLGTRRLYVVTVTYGQRGHLLRQLIHRCLSEEIVAKVIVVDNGSRSPLLELVEGWEGRCSIVRNSDNLGSAVAFGRGIEIALADGAEFLLLMDDDNAPAPGCIQTLVQELDARMARGGSCIAVVGYRPSHQPGIAKGIPVPRPSSFLGFDVRQIPQKLTRRFGRSSGRTTPSQIELPFAPYGGLLAQRTTFEKIGLPLPEFVLYADDTEYTARIRSLDGTIILVTEARIDDLETSWNTETPARNAAAHYVRSESDMRVFYSLRNRVWFDRHRFCHCRTLFSINKVMFLVMVWIEAQRAGRLDRFKLIRQAVRDGEQGRLGSHPQFPLPT